MTRDQREHKNYVKSSNKKFKIVKSMPKSFRRKSRSSKIDKAKDKNKRIWDW